MHRVAATVLLLISPLVVHGTPSRRMIRYDPSYSSDYDYRYVEPQPVPVQVGGSRNLLEIPNMLFNNLAKEGMGALNKLFDKGEGFLARGFDSIQRIGSGIQNAFNKFAGGAIEGINRAHEEKKKTINDAIINPLFSLFGFRPQQPTENPFAGIDPALLLRLAENLKEEAVPGANEAF